ncbi:DUF1361 domain-containing protein [Fulvivirgaceae bacterium BMA12]|uniref:DUF1361 domain-containing protein n=1 Tax=Agaribacillus aureus TaxID=3051825 RepID=A0ABT8L0A8_9BACT|nr:DUF1361 domain-containing protein [Fulvivirgaceae bacterium BMA12]
MSARIFITGNITYIFLSWNLFLAWVPLALAFMLRKTYHQGDHPLSKVVLMPLFSLWLLFFPNAPYLVTDLVHINYHYGARYWFDLVLIYLFAFSGLSTGMLSLYWVHQVIKEMFSPIWGWLAVAGSSLLAGYGVYLGRILRWNSWDLFTHPLQVLKDSTLQIHDHTAQAITLVFGLLLFSIYFLFISLLQYKYEPYGQIQH